MMLRLTQLYTLRNRKTIFIELYIQCLQHTYPRIELPKTKGTSQYSNYCKNPPAKTRLGGCMKEWVR